MHALGVREYKQIPEVKSGIPPLVRLMSSIRGLGNLRWLLSNAPS